MVKLSHNKPGTNQIPVKFRGKEYSNLADLCRNFGHKPENIRARLARGASLADAIDGVFKKRKGRFKKFIFKEKKFQSRIDFKKYYGEKWFNVQRRIKRGWTEDQALKLSPPPPRFRDHYGHARKIKWKKVIIQNGNKVPDHDGEGYKLYLITNLINKKTYVGITIGSLDKRLKSHISQAINKNRKNPLANAIRKYGVGKFKIKLIKKSIKYDDIQYEEVKEIQKRNSIKKGYNVALGGSLGTSRPIKVNGKLFLSQTEAASNYGIDPAVWSLRVSRLGWTPEEAAELVKREYQRLELIIKEKKYPSFAAAARQLAPHIPVTTAYRRYHHSGWTIEQALDLADHPDFLHNKVVNPIKIRGKKYPSFAAAARQLAPHIPVTTAYRRYHHSGWTIEQALDLSFGSDLFHRKKNGGIPVMIRGVKYKSIQKAYMKLKPNIKISVIYSRIKKGFLVEDAFFYRKK